MDNLAVDDRIPCLICGKKFHQLPKHLEGVLI